MVGPRGLGDESAAAFAGNDEQACERPGAESLEPAPRIVTVPLPWQVPLEWQGELDTALEDIDSRLIRGRRSTDSSTEPISVPASAARALTLTPEALEALALRVAERLRAEGQVHQPTARQARQETHGMRSETVISIRFRWPLFSLPFFGSRRRRRTLTGVTA